MDQNKKKRQVEGEMEIDIHIGRKIRERRISLGMTQSEFAHRLGITFQQIQKVEKGANRVPAGRLLLIARIMDVPISYFYDGMEDPSDPKRENEIRASVADLRMIGMIPTDVRMAVRSLIKAIADSNGSHD